MGGCAWEAGQLPQVAEGQVVPGRQRLGASRRDLLTCSSRWGDFSLASIVSRSEAITDTAVSGSQL